MPLSIPTPLSDISAAVWTYLSRLVTNPQAAELANLDASISSREAEADAAARYAALPSDIWGAGTRDLTKKVLSETSIMLDYAGAHSEPETFSDANLHSLSTMSTITPVVIPDGATANNATLLMLLSMENYDGVLQIITVTTYFRKAGDDWGIAVSTAQHKFTIPAIAHQAIIVPLLAEVGALTADVYEVRIDVQASAANRMDYILQGILAPAFIEA